MSDYTYMINVLYLLIPTLIASIFGLAVIFPKTHGLYYRMPVFAMICTCVGQISYFVLLLTGNNFNPTFNVGALGPLGAALFLLVANVGSTARFISARDTNPRKHNLLALIAPLTFIILYVIFAIIWVKKISQDVSMYQSYFPTIQSAIMWIVSGITAYFTFRAVILDYPKESFAYCMRPYNIVITLILVLLNIERTLRFYEFETEASRGLLHLLYTLLGLLIIAALPLLERGRKKFLTL